MSWGDTLAGAYNAATDTAKQAAGTMMSSVANAAAAVRDKAVAAAQASAAGARTAADAVVSAAVATRDAAAEAARMGGNVVGFGARAVVDGAGKTVRLATDLAADTVTAPFKAARNLFAPVASPAKTAVEPCPKSWPGKKARLEKRQQMIRDGKRSHDPDVRASADRFAQNNEAVELARLSADSYVQSPLKSPPPDPPVGWSVASKSDLRAMGLDPDLMDEARAVLYQTPKDWPGGQKTVLAFRGTDDLEDGIVDHDQAMALETKQYKAAMLLGTEVSERLGSDVLVTGHSLGGGKAQAAGATGGLGGMMFNAAGLNPDTVNGKLPDPSQFTQYRTTGDPLTGAQNSPAIQAAIVGIVGPASSAFGGGMKVGDALVKIFGGSGLSPEAADYADKAFKVLPRSLRNIAQSGNAMPPAIGAIHEVQTLNDAGEVVSPANLLGQHSMGSVVNGIEQEKSEDMAALEGAD